MSFRQFGGLNYSAKSNIITNQYSNSGNLGITDTLGQPNSKIVSQSHIDMSANSVLHIGKLYFMDGTVQSTAASNAAVATTFPSGIIISGGNITITSNTLGNITGANLITANTVNATTFNGTTFNGTNFIGGTFNGSLIGGFVGSIVYQSASNVTAFSNEGTDGYFLKCQGTTPTWVSVAGSLDLAAVLSYGNSAGSNSINMNNNRITTVADIQTSTINTGGNEVTIGGIAKFLNTTDATNSTSGAIVVSGGIGVAKTVSSKLLSGPTGLTATPQFAGGATGSIPYQSNISATRFLAATTTNGSMLAYDTTVNAPKWVAPNATTITTVDTTTPIVISATLYPVMTLGPAAGVEKVPYVDITAPNFSYTTNTGTLTVPSAIDVSSPNTTFNLLNTPTTITFGGAATAINIGSGSTGTLTINNPTIATSKASVNLLNTTASTINFAGAATAINVGSGSTGTLTINNPTIATSQTTTPVNLLNTNAQNINFGGAATTISIGKPDPTGKVTINSTQAATTATSAALVVKGGIGVGADSYFGTGVVAVNQIKVATNGIALGYLAGVNQGLDAVAISGGVYGRTNQGQYAVAIGYNSGASNQGTNAVAIGCFVGELNQGTYAVAIGCFAGQNSQGTNAVATGTSAGSVNQGENAIAIGLQAGSENQGMNAIAIGSSAGGELGPQYQEAIAIGNFAGGLLQGTGAIALGVSAGRNGQGTNSVSIGYDAGKMSQSQKSIAIGDSAGAFNQGHDAVAIGSSAGGNSQREYAVAVGASAGQNTQGAKCVAIGIDAGSDTQGQSSVALGDACGAFFQGQLSTAVGAYAGHITQGAGSVAIGNSAGNNIQGNYAVAVGYSAGQSTQGPNAVAIGNSAGASNQGQYAVAIGSGAGSNTQGQSSVAIGVYAGNLSQGSDSVAIGSGAGSNTQGQSSVAIGVYAGNLSQGSRSVAIGYSAGQSTQGPNAIAIGLNVALQAQGDSAIAIGRNAGQNTQGPNAVAIGNTTGQLSQGINAIAIGQNAGQYTQGQNAVAIGSNAGNLSQGPNAVAIGNSAGATNQGQNSIVINATGSVLNCASQSAFCVAPIRKTQILSNILAYTDSSEIIVLPSGSDAEVLTYNGTSGPTWEPITITNISIDTTSLNQDYYPTFVSATSGSLPLYVGADMKFNPSTKSFTLSGGSNVDINSTNGNGVSLNLSYGGAFISKDLMVYGGNIYGANGGTLNIGPVNSTIDIGNQSDLVKIGNQEPGNTGTIYIYGGQFSVLSTDSYFTTSNAHFNNADFAGTLKAQIIKGDDAPGMTIDTNSHEISIGSAGTVSGSVVNIIGGNNASSTDTVSTTLAALSVKDGGLFIQQDLMVYGGDIYGPNGGTLNIGPSANGEINIGDTSGNTSLVNIGGSITFKQNSSGGTQVIEWSNNSGTALGLIYSSTLGNEFAIDMESTLTNGFKIKLSGSDIFTVSTAGACTATSFTSTSDYRIKENTKLLDNTFSIDNLKPVTYRNKLTEKQDIGFIAHELQEEFPYLVTGEKDGENMQSLNYIGLIGVLVKEIQDLKKRVSILENK
jgi:hypothetical protein